MVYDLAMLKAFYTLYEGENRTHSDDIATSVDFSGKNLVCSFVR